MIQITHAYTGRVYQTLIPFDPIDGIPGAFLCHVGRGPKPKVWEIQAYLYPSTDDRKFMGKVYAKNGRWGVWIRTEDWSRSLTAHATTRKAAERILLNTIGEFWP